MAQIEFKNVAHAYGANPKNTADWALKPLDHVWQDGGAYALLGPSGCGKTTLLNAISGLIQVSQGDILFDGRSITGLPTRERNIAQVFQFPVIYDTMTVFNNLAFPLRNRGVDEATIKTRVNEVAEMLELSDELKRRASNLSADAKQKISMGRGLVRSDVAAILFDEPLTVIDQVVVMNDGQVMQVGTPQQLFETPQHTFVGYFIGSPGMNVIPCQFDAAGGAALIHQHRIPLRLNGSPPPSGRSLEIGIRPEFLTLHSADSAPADGTVPVTVSAIEDLGNYKIVTARLADDRALKIKVPEQQSVAIGPAQVQFPAAQTKLYSDGQLV